MSTGDRAQVHVSAVSLPNDREADVVEPAGGGRGPGMVFLHWFDTEAPDSNRTQFRDEAVELAMEHGVVSVLPQGRFPWAEPPTDAAADVARIRDEVAAHRAAVDLLLERDGVDPARIALVGHDFGAMHGLVLAAEDDRIAGVVGIAATPRWGDWFLPFWPIAGDRFDYLRALAPLDPVSVIGRIAPRPVLLQFARGDFYIADMSGLELHRAAGEPRTIKAYESDHAMRVPAARLDRTTFLATALGWLP